MSKHTKGPWEIETYSDGMLQIIGDVRAVDEYCDEFTTVTEQVYGLDNARLIAAVPELYDSAVSAQKLLITLYHEAKDRLAKSIILQTLNELDASIKKVRAGK